MSDNSMEVRMDRLEQWKANTDAQLYGSFGKPGLIQEMRTFFDSRKRSDNTLVLKIGAMGILLPIAYDILKHIGGWR